LEYAPTIGQTHGSLSTWVFINIDISIILVFFGAFIEKSLTSKFQTSILLKKRDQMGVTKVTVIVSNLAKSKPGYEALFSVDTVL
jgi:hypothetical protein